MGVGPASAMNEPSLKRKPYTGAYTYSFPRVRPRRLRASRALRDLVSETLLSPSKLIQPLFISESAQRPRPIASLPGLFSYPPESPELVDYVQEGLERGVGSFLLFASPRSKTRLGEPAYSPRGPVQVALRHLRRELGWEPLLFTDLCLCGYTSEGHCGLVIKAADGRGLVVDNDSTLELYAKIAVAQAEAGADFVAPSGMMDGQVGAIREALDSEGFTQVGIMSYTAKYASGFYGPFREAVSSHPGFGDRTTYQMDPRNRGEALKEALLDLVEGADILMVKPALSYLDVIFFLKQELPHVPLAAYSVSGEYLMVHKLAEAGMADRGSLLLEIALSIKRAGADLVITYAAYELAGILNSGGGAK